MSTDTQTLANIPDDAKTALLERMTQFVRAELEKRDDFAQKRIDSLRANFDATKESDSYLGALTDSVINYGYDAFVAEAFRQHIHRFFLALSPTTNMLSFVTKEHARSLEQMLELKPWQANSTNVVRNIVNQARADALAQWIERLGVIKWDLERLVEQEATREAALGNVYRQIKNAGTAEIAHIMNIVLSGMPTSDAVLSVLAKQKQFVAWVRAATIERRTPFESASDAFAAYVRSPEYRDAQ